MDQGITTFKMSTLQRRGMVEFSEEGLDVMRSLLLLWIQECERSEERARQFGFGTDPKIGQKEAIYYRNARAFLMHLLTCRLKSRVKLEDQLRWVARWREDCDLPAGWLELLQLHTEDGVTSGTIGTSQGGGGTGGVGGDGSTRMASGQERPVVSDAPDVDAPGADPGQGDGTHGAPADDKGAKRTGNHRGRGGQRDPSGGANATGGPKGKRPAKRE